MHYTLLFYFESSGFDGRKDPATQAQYREAWIPYQTALREAGVMVSGGGLEGPHSAKTLRVRGGQTKVQDGPYPDTKEQLGGFIVIDVPTLDAAIDWAARCPIAPFGSIEVRPNLPVSVCH